MTAKKKKKLNLLPYWYHLSANRVLKKDRKLRTIQT